MLDVHDAHVVLVQAKMAILEVEMSMVPYMSITL
jgi:hypothetical protein